MKWPKIKHLPWSPGVSREDQVLDTVDCFIGEEVIITEKLDGENTSLLHDSIHARSLNNGYHPSRNWVKGLHGNIKHQIPFNMQIVGESVFAKHTIYYHRLSSYFYVFAAMDLENQRVLSVAQTMKLAENLGLHYVPILYKGPFYREFTVPEASVFGLEVEGFVVRLAQSFPIADFDSSMAKWVRTEHVQTDEHWQKNWTQNQLRRR